MELLKFKITPLSEMYYSEDSLYGVYRFSTKEEIPNSTKTSMYDKDFVFTSTLVGKMQRLSIGLEYECEASMVFNKKFNNYQYEVKNIKANKPTTLEKQKAFLTCVVSEKQANTLLEAFPNILELITEDKPVDLSKTKGIKEATFKKIKDRVLENYVLADLLTLLKPLGVTLVTIKRLQEFEENPVLLKKLLKENPYILTQIRGFGFAKVDKLALQINPKLKISEFRAKAFITNFLQEVSDNNGSTRVLMSDLDNAVKTKINECYRIYQEILEKELSKETFLHIQDKNIGLKHIYEREVEILNLLNQINNAPCKFSISGKDIEKAFNEFEIENGYSLTNEQKSTVINTNNSNVIIVTGKAGTGKSSVIKAITKAFSNQKISLCALSAKASQRITEATDGMEASTIHRLLGFVGKDFLHNENLPLSSDVIVVDEASMINISLFLSLLKAIKKGAKLVIVFDDGQLPPIGAGNIAKDLLKSSFSKTYLSKVHRQAEKSGILTDANTIRDGVNPIREPKSMEIRGELKDMYYAFRSSKEDIFDTVIKYYIKSLNNLSTDEMCICVPRKKDAVNSTFEYNNKIQEILLGNEKLYVQKGFKIFKLGAKLIQKVNNYDKSVVNGEVGYLNNINIIDKKFTVRFGSDKIVEYTIDEMEELELAYALTTHATQGSQYHTVFIALDMASYVLLSKELIYTAITRASKRCMVVAEPKSFSIGIKTKASERKTWLQRMV